RPGRDRAQGARTSAHSGLPLGSVRNHDHRLRPGHRGRPAAAGDGLCDPVRRRGLPQADDPEGRAGSSAVAGPARVQRRYELPHAVASPPRRDEGNRSKGRRSGVPHRRQDRDRAEDHQRPLQPVDQPHELRRRVPDGRPALRDRRDARRAEGHAGNLRLHDGGLERRPGGEPHCQPHRSDARRRSRYEPRTEHGRGAAVHSGSEEARLEQGLNGVKLRDIADVDSDSTVTGFAIDHRKVARGSVFGAFRGAVFNGEDFIGQAVDRGAVAVVAQPGADVQRVPLIADSEPRRLFAELAAKFYAPFPETVVAVTGTNGKTSTVEMTRQIWRMSGHRSASIGTLGVTTSDDQVKTGLTTPDIVTFLNNMAGLKRMGISHVAYEASSHGLDQHRAEGVPLAAAAFTNFSRDHLDYHPSMDAYFEAKMRLFEELLPSDKPVVVWTDDPKSREVIERSAARGHQVLTVGRNGDMIRLVEQTPTSLGQALLLEYEDRRLKLSLPLIGAYQAANVLVAAGLALATGIGFDRVFSAMQRVAPVRGRLERAVISRAGVPVYVDYAHTPDALEAAIAALRPHVEGRLITVFGAGGDRDQGKRPEMGRVAIEMSDVVIVTDDNPRSEDP